MSTNNSEVMSIIKDIETVLFSDYDEMKRLAEKLLDLSTKENDPYGLCKANNVLGILCSDKGLVDEALEYYSEAMSYTLLGDLHQEKPVLLNNIGTALITRQNYFEAIENMTSAINLIFETGHRKDLLFTLHLNIASAYLQINEPDEALKLIEEASPYYDGNTDDYTEKLGLIANAHLIKGDYEKAYSFILLCEEQAQKSNYKVIKLLVDYYKARYFELTDDVDAAELFYMRVLNEQFRDTPYYYFNQVALDYIKFAFKCEDYVKATGFIMKALKLVKQNGWHWVLMDYYKYLAEGFRHLGDINNAQEAMDTYFQLEQEHRKKAHINLYNCFKIQEKVLDMNLVNRSLNESVTRLKAFNTVIKEINLAEEVILVLEKQYDALRALFKMDTLALGLFDEDLMQIEYVIKVENGERIGVSAIPYTNKRSFSIWVKDNEKPLIINDLDEFDAISETYPNLKLHRSDITQFGNYSKSVVIWPMRIENQVIGLINCQAIQKNNFSSFDLELIEMLASHLAIAIDNQRQKQALNTAVNRLNRLSYTDSLTGVYNRQALNEFLPNLYEDAMAQKKSLSFAMVDLDNFKQLNDQFGHQMGDQCLYEFAKLLEATVGSLGYIYRYGGDEFSLLFVGLDPQIVEALLDDIIQKSRNFYSVGEVLNITASIGAVFLEAGKIGPTNLNTFINYADNALYIAKNEGKNVYKKVVI